MKETAMEVWKWDGGYGMGGWLTEKISGVGEMMDNSLSNGIEMDMRRLNLRDLWEKPMNTFKSVSDRFCEACSGVTDLKLSQQRSTIRKKLSDWASSLEVAVIAKYKLMERALVKNEKYIEPSPQQSTLDSPNLNLVSLGYVKQMPIASRSTIVCDNLDTIQDVARSVSLRICDFEGSPCNLIDRHVELRVVLMYDEGDEIDVSVSRAEIVGEYNISFRTSRPGRATLSVKLHGVDVAGSPRNITIHPSKDWTYEDVVPSFVGTEGAGPGQFQRPWGIGCDRQGRLLVADRTNNRVQVLREDGHFLFQFGKKGTGPGEFQLVSAVAGAPNGDLICVDKDNHRIQVFSEEGHFRFSFGEFGEKAGQFHYPWDVDVNARGEIVVTDSKNSRIQLFTASGRFVKEFGRNDFQELESPRGVSFINTNEVVLTDFNRHSLIIVNMSTKKHNLICREGSDAGQLRRPQGVAWHPQGFIVVGDFRNNRIQAVDRFGSKIWEFLSGTWPHAKLDRPCGVGVSKKGNVLSVDFGNNRIVILK